MDQTTTGPTTATTDPARRRGLARVLVACSVLAVVLRPVASAVLFPSGDFGMVGSRFARLISIVNVTNLLLTLVAAGLAVAVIVLGAMSLKQRGPGSSGWHETTGMSCVAAAVLVLCPPFHVVVAEPEALMTLHLVTSAVAVLASVMGLVFVGLALRGSGQSHDHRDHPTHHAPGRALLATVLAAGALMVLTVGSTGLFVPLDGPRLPWLQPLVLVVVTVMAVLGLVLAVRARRDDGAVPAAEESGAVAAPQAPQAPQTVRAPQTETDRGLLAARLLGTPAAMLLLVLSLVFGEFVVGLMLVAGVAAVIAVIAAVVEARRRTDGRRWLDAIGEILVPGALLITPVAVLIMSITDETGWGALAGLLWGGLLSILVGLIGLVFTVVSVIGGRHESPISAISALATAATFIPVALLVPLLGAGSGGPVVAVIAGLFLLVGLIASGIAVAQRHDRF